MSPSLGVAWVKRLMFKLILKLVQGLVFEILHAVLNEGILWFYYNQLNGRRAESESLREREVLNNEGFDDYNVFKDSDGFNSM